MKIRTPFFFLTTLMAITFAQPTVAAATLATPEQDRRAKQSVPAAGKALIYVYRLKDASDVVPSLWLNGRASGSLEPGTYGMWAAGAGRLEIRAGQADAKPLSFSSQAGQVYFVQLNVDKSGAVSLRPVAEGVGRTDLQQARLVLDPTLAARAPQPAPAPAAPVPPPVTVKQTPVARAADPVARPTPARQRSMPVDDEPAASGITLIGKVGSFTLASDAQTILGGARTFAATNVAYGIEGEWRFRSGFAVGLEFFGHSQEYTTDGATGSGEMAATNLLFNFKKYFRPSAVVQPYLGVGFGSTVADFSPGSSSGVSGITGTVGGFAVQGMAGVAFRWRHVGIYTEFKYVSAEAEGTDSFTGLSESVDLSGTGFFAGMNVHF